MNAEFRIVIAYFLAIATHTHAETQAAWPGGGVDAHGVRHRDSAQAKGPVWVDDLVYKTTAEYSQRERALRHTGTALLRLRLDLQSGSVITAELIKSTGFASLDQSALDAIRHWLWRSNRWKELDVAITFFIGSGSRMSIGPKP
jgi:TonB family protein